MLKPKSTVVPINIKSIREMKWETIKLNYQWTCPVCKSFTMNRHTTNGNGFLYDCFNCGNYITYIEDMATSSMESIKYLEKIYTYNKDKDKDKELFTEDDYYTET